MRLLDLISHNADILSKASDTFSLQRKEAAWVYVTEVFNYKREDRREKAALQVLFTNMKTTARKKYRDWREKCLKIGSFDSYDSLPQELRCIDAMIPGFLEKPFAQCEDDSIKIAETFRLVAAHRYLIVSLDLRR